MLLHLTSQDFDDDYKLMIGAWNCQSYVEVVYPLVILQACGSSASRVGEDCECSLALSDFYNLRNLSFGSYYSSEV